MIYLNTFSERFERSVLARRPGDQGPRKVDAGGTEFLMASSVLGAARWLHRRRLIGAGGFRIALNLAERLSARGIAKWRAARRCEASKVEKGP
jgi:hypothetical protein